MDKMWYYALGGTEKNGPVTEVELRNLLADGKIKPTDLIWSDGMSNWVPASSLAEAQTPPIIAPPDSVQPIASGAELPNGLLAWMNFVGIMNIIGGALTCLSCIGIVTGIFMILSGIALVGAKGLLANTSHINSELLPFFQKLKTFMLMTGILYILSIVFTLIMFVIYFGIFAAAIAGLAGHSGALPFP